VAAGPWSVILTNIPGTGATVVVTNAGAGASSKGFFRTQSLP
jgi:hypothetical protein